MTGRTALVTGAGRGIGREIALTLARDGVDIAVNYNSSESAARETAEQIEAMGRKAVLLPCDVADFKASGEMVQRAVESLGRLDILINNAGITRDNLLLRMTEKEFDAVLDTNLKGCFHLIRHVAKVMLKQRYGRIVNLSSISGVLGNAGQANYSASKAGIIGLTKSAARELASRNITVNAIAPGFIDTEMTKDLSDSVKESILAQIPMRRFGSTKDIAEAAKFLVSDYAAYITGQVIQINGGMAM